MRKKKSDELFPSYQVILELISYNREHYDKYDQVSIEELIPKLNPDRVNWINLDGLSNLKIIEKLQSHFHFDALVVEDILNDQRPKAEELDDYLYFTMKMLHSIEGNKIEYEQISFLLGTNYLISFQEKAGDLFDPFRDRIKLDQGRVRKMKSDYLLYRLIDIIVDNYYVVLDNIGDQIEEIEEHIHTNSSEHGFQKIQALKKELIFLRKAVYPLREALSKILKEESSFIEEGNFRYYSDVYDHTVHLIDSLDTYKDLISSLMDIHINTMNTKMNEVMKLLTIITTIFIPLSFIAGIYGMNFDVMPELRWYFGYPAVLAAMGAVAIAMLIFFKRKKWF
jgi:magnesium transporter